MFIIDKTTKPTLEYIKQLEQKYKLLKERFLKDMLNDNTETARSDLKVNMLDKEIDSLKRKNAHLVLFGN